MNIICFKATDLLVLLSYIHLICVHEVCINILEYFLHSTLLYSFRHVLDTVKTRRDKVVLPNRSVVKGHCLQSVFLQQITQIRGSHH